MNMNMKNVTANDVKEARRAASLGFFINTWRMIMCVIVYKGLTIKVEPRGKLLTVSVGRSTFVGAMRSNSRHAIKWALIVPPKDVEDAVLAVLLASDGCIKLDADKPAERSSSLLTDEKSPEEAEADTDGSEDAEAEAEASEETEVEANASDGAYDDVDAEPMSTLITSYYIEQARKRMTDPRIQKGLSRVLSGFIIPHRKMLYRGESGRFVVEHVNGTTVRINGKAFRVSADMLVQASADGIPQVLWDLLCVHYYVEADLACRPKVKVVDNPDLADLDRKAAKANEKAANNPTTGYHAKSHRTLDLPDVILVNGGDAYDDVERKEKRHYTEPKFQVHVPMGIGRKSMRVHKEYTRYSWKPDRGFAYDPSEGGDNKKA